MVEIIIPLFDPVRQFHRKGLMLGLGKMCTSDLSCSRTDRGRWAQNQ
jgi:hypothetical protein